MADLKKILDVYMSNKGDEQEYEYNYYHDDKAVVPVYSRTSVSELKQATHTNIHINFFEDIIQRKTGYMSTDIKVKVKEEDVALTELLTDYDIRTKQATNNIESIANASISGISHRLSYTIDGVVYIKNIPGWQVVYDWTNDIFDPSAAYYYYMIEDVMGVKVYHCDVYDKKNVTYFIRQKQDNNKLDVYVEDPGKEAQPHNFNQVPITPFLNNNDWVGDCKDALPLMDVYDEIISDTSGELKAARLAYLKIWGDLYTGQYDDGSEISIPDYLREFGTMLFGKDELGNNLGDAEFLEKKLDDASITHMLDRLRGHIFEVSGSVDLKELTDNADARVFTIQASLSRLENNSKITENFTKMALRKQYALLFDIMSETGKGSWDVSDIDITFTRVFVIDKEALGRMLVQLMNVMSAEDAYEISGLFDDPSAAVERYRKEQGLLIFNEEGE